MTVWSCALDAPREGELTHTACVERSGAGSKERWGRAHQCVAGSSPVYTKKSGPLLPPAQPTIPRVIIGP